MTFWLNVLRLIRRRNVAIAATVLAALLGAAAYLVLPVNYVSSATVVLTPSPTDQAPGTAPGSTRAINPLLNFNEGLNTALSILVQAMNTPEALAQLTGKDTSTSVTITDVGNAEFLGNKGPFLFITGRSSQSGAAARDIVVRADQAARQELLDRQRDLNVPQSQLITTLFVVPPSEPVASSSTRLQGTAFGFVLGFIVSVAGAYGLEMRRAGRRRTTGDATAGAPAGDGALATEALDLTSPPSIQDTVPVPAAPARAPTPQNGNPQPPVHYVESPTERLGTVVRRAANDADQAGRPPGAPAPSGGGPRRHPSPAPRPRPVRPGDDPSTRGDEPGIRVQARP